MERMQFWMTDKYGKKVAYYVVATYHHDKTNKDFIIYTDHTTSKEGGLNLYYSLYMKKDNYIKLLSFENDYDRKVAKVFADSIISSIKEAV